MKNDERLEIFGVSFHGMDIKQLLFVVIARTWTVGLLDVAKTARTKKCPVFFCWLTLSPDTNVESSVGST
jgi:hypothetical protein